MLILNNNDYSKLNEIVCIELSNIEKINKLFSNQKNILIKYFNIVLTSMSGDSSILIELNKILEGFNTIFDKINLSLSDTNSLINKLKDIQECFSDNNYDYNIIENLYSSYNDLYIEKYITLLDNIYFITTFIEDVFVAPIYEKSMENTRNIFTAQLSSLEEDLKNEEKRQKELEKNIKKQNDLSREQILDRFTNNTVQEVEEKLPETDNNIENENIINTNITENESIIHSTPSSKSEITNNNDIENAKTYENENEQEINDKTAEKILKDLEKITENANIETDLSQFSNTIPQLSNDTMNLENENISEDTTSSKITKLPLQDNDTLIISEKDGLVYLPFKVEDLKHEYLEKSRKYSGLIDLINHEYIVPINKYRNTVTSRFKEAYFLMTYKEKNSTLAGLELGLELAFNYSLHPSIISACKSLEELDSYLYALESKDLSKFNSFKINFELIPKTQNI